MCASLCRGVSHLQKKKTENEKKDDKERQERRKKEIKKCETQKRGRNDKKDGTRAKEREKEEQILTKSHFFFLGGIYKTTRNGKCILARSSSDTF